MLKSSNKQYNSCQGVSASIGRLARQYARYFFAFGGILGFFTWLVISTQADGGCLDQSFGSGGKVTTDFGPQTDASGAAVALQSDGKLVVAGGGRDNSTFRDAFALARYNGDGTLDTSFGSGGKVITHVGSRNESIATAVAIQADGKTVATGIEGLCCGGTGFDFGLVRYNADGSLDSSFGSAGQLTTDFGNDPKVTVDDLPHAIAIQADGKIVVAGQGGPAIDFAVARYNTNGSLDPTFGSGGKVTTDFSGHTDSANSIAIQSDGKILVGGSANSGGGGVLLALARYNTDGSLDGTFGGGGRSVFDAGTLGDARVAIALQPDGKIVAAGTIALGGVQSTFVVARFNSNGVVDSGFGSSGKTVIDFPGDRGGASSVAIQTDGKIVAGGTAFTGNGSQNEDFALARLETSGLIDNQFGTGGKVTTDFFGQIDGGSGMVIQPDGKIVLAGSAASNTGNNFALARYLADGCASSDLSITKTGLPPSVLAGQNVTYSLSVTNNGPDAATNVVLKDFTPSNASVVSVLAPAGWVCPPSNLGSAGTVTCNKSSLPANEADHFTIVFQAGNSSTTLFNVASVSGNNPDPNPNNNSANALTAVITLDTCIQDDSTGDTLKFNSTTGDYLFTRCGHAGFTFAGRGTVRSVNGILSLTDSRPDRRITASFFPNQSTGRATITLSVVQGVFQTFTLNQTNTRPSCACPQ